MGTNTGSFASRMQGHWSNGAAACADGPSIKREGDRLVITQPGARYVYRIESDKPLETSVSVVEPTIIAGDAYLFTPEFNATSDERSFNLVIRNVANGSTETWRPCEV